MVTTQTKQHDTTRHNKYRNRETIHISTDMVRLSSHPCLVCVRVFTGYRFTAAPGNGAASWGIRGAPVLWASSDTTLMLTSGDTDGASVVEVKH